MDIEPKSEPRSVASPIEIKSPDGKFSLRQFTPEDSQDLFSLLSKGNLSQLGDNSLQYPTPESVKDSVEHPENQALLFSLVN